MNTFLTNINIRKFLIYSFFFFMPAAYTYPGRAYYHLTGLQNYKDFSLLHLLLLPSVVFALCCIAARLYNSNYNFKNFTYTINSNKIILGIIFLWTLAATVSLCAHYTVDVATVTYMAIYVTSILVYIAFSNLSLTKEEYLGIFLSLSIGAAIPLISGAVEYYATWGVPNASTLLYSHCDIKKMQNYGQLTFGNPGNTAAFLILLIPSLFALLLDKVSRPLKILFAIILIFALINLIITYSRTGILITLTAMAIVSLMRNRQTFVIYILSLFLFWLILRLLCPEYLWVFLNYMSNATPISLHSDHAIAYINPHLDASVMMRGSAIKFGWDTYQANLLTGIGPGANLYYNPFVTAHQFNVEQAAELGTLGLIASLFLCIATFMQSFKLIIQKNKKYNYQKFTFIIGPTCYIAYAVIANVALSIGVVNTWVALFCAFLALSGCQIKEDFSKIPIKNLTTLNETC